MQIAVSMSTNNWVNWNCPTCLSSELPFANSSIMSDASLSLSHFDVSNTSSSTTEPVLTPLMECKTSPIFCHLNVQSLLPKLDEVRSTLTEIRLLGLSGWTPLYRMAKWTYHLLWCTDVIVAAVEVEFWCMFSEGYRSRRAADGAEIIWIELGNIYRPPNAGRESLDNISCMLETVASERRGCSDGWLKL